MSLEHLRFIENYANLIISLGINVQKNQKVLIESSYYSYEFARLLAQKCYKKGADFVKIDVKDNYLIQSKLKYSPNESIEYVPEFMKKMYETMAEEKWSIIRIDNTGEFGLTSHINKNLQEKYERAWAKAADVYRRIYMRNRVSWCAVCFPDPMWASLVLEKEPSLEAQKELWEIMIPILKLNTKDPIQAWKDNNQVLQNRCRYLNTLKIQELHFREKSLGTDLRVELCEEAVWMCADVNNQSGTPFLANIPTEEVCTTPHKRGVNGKVYTTSPTKILENLVDEAWFEFKEGKVIDWGAKKNKDILDQFFSMDEAARHMGEIALVDISTPIYQSNKIFSSILYDENGSSHFAFGASYLVCTQDGPDLKPEVLEKRGANESIVHKDFMLGSPNLQVEAIDKNGKTHLLIKNGKFTF